MVIMGDVNIGNTGGFKEHTYAQAGTLPANGADILTARLTPEGETALFRVDFATSIAGVLSVTFKVGSTTTSAALFGGAALTAGVLFPTEFLVSRANETVNFTFTRSTGSGGTYRLVVREV